MPRLLVTHILPLSLLIGLAAGCDRADEGPGPQLPAVDQLALSDPGLGNRLDLQWRNPDSGQVTSVRVLRFAGQCVEDPASSAAEAVFELPLDGPGQTQAFRDEPAADVTLLPDGRQTCYAVFCKAGADYSAARTVSGSATDSTAPAALSGFTAVIDPTPGSVGIELSWTVGGEEDLVVRVLRRADAPVDGLDDPLAESVCAGQTDGCYDPAVVDGTTYHYLAWTEDEVPNRSQPQSASARRMVDDDQDGPDEDGGDCNDDDDRIHPGADALDCSATDWDCDGLGYEVAYCLANPPGVKGEGCIDSAQQVSCDAAGCHWPVLTCPNSGEECVDGGCMLVDDCVPNGQGYYECIWWDPASAFVIVVPAGPFSMGCNAAIDTCDDPSQGEESPYHVVDLPAYGIDANPATIYDYTLCVNNGDCPALTEPCAQGEDEQPIVCVTWDEARQFCDAKGKRLCTEAEWEKAARGPDGQLYPWGNELADCSRAVMNDSGVDDPANYGCGTGSVQPVWSRDLNVSPYGVVDMAGNCWQWVADWFGAGYYANSPTYNPQGPASGTYRIFRGGDYSKDAFVLVSSRRGAVNPDARATIGIRCCVTLEAAE